jgi:hypothetical protein
VRPPLFANSPAIDAIAPDAPANPPIRAKEPNFVRDAGTLAA